MNIGIFCCTGVELNVKEFNFAILQTLAKIHENDNMYLFMLQKSSRMQKFIEGTHIRLVNLTDFMSIENWPEKYEKGLEILEKYKIDKMYVTKQLILQSYNYKNDTTVRTFLDNWKTNPTFSMNFVMMRNCYEKLCFQLCIAKKCPTVELVLDPQAIDLSKNIHYKKGYKRVYILNKKKLNLDYAKIYEPMYDFRLNEKEYEKTHDLCFACTALTNDRKYIIDAFMNNKFDKKWLVNIVSKETSKRISQTEYFEWQGQSKYTLMIPAYDVSTISIPRIFEGLMYDCICLIHSKCDLTDLRDTFPSVYEVANKYLIVEKLSKIKDKVKELDYDLVLKELKDACIKDKVYDIKYAKKLMDKAWEGLK